jgi:hypothetical protein
MSVTIDKSLYYDPNKMLSYNRILNCVIGARGIGKSYGLKKYVVNRAIKQGKQFIYLRRYKDELKKIINFFNDIKHEFPNHELRVKGRQFFYAEKGKTDAKGNIKWILIGWAIPLSAWQSEKSNAYPDVETILFDEFIREKDNSGYIPNEVPALLNLMDTVFRGRDNVRCVCLSNSVTILNPYFLYFGLLPDITKRFNAYKSVLVEIPDSKDFANERRKTKFGELIDGTEYGEMSLDNKFVNDSSVFIEKRSKESKFQFTVVYNGMSIGVWVDVQRGIMYLANEHDPYTKLSFALTKDDASENTMLTQGWKQNYYLKKMVSAFLKGYLRFDNQVLRGIGYEMFQKMHIQ